MSNTKIEWADKVWNPISGCTKVSSGCKNCYAETYAKRFWGERKFTDVQCHGKKLEEPLHWKKPQRIFVNSMSDLFHPDVSFEFIQDVFETMTKCPQHIFMILTKRPNKMLDFITVHFMDLQINELAKNIWLGVSVEDQKIADERIPLLLQTPAAIRFISTEPLLSEINFAQYFMMTERNFPMRAHEIIEHGKLDWVICGGESGKNARPMHPDWARSLRDQCKEANIPFFFKQWGQYIPSYQAGEKSDEIADYNQTYGARWVKRCHHFDDGISMVKVGKKKAGRSLDRIEHNAFPIIK